MNANILIIDDDAEIRYSLQRVLSKHGYEVTAAASGEEGIETVATLNPEVVFLDNRMAGMNGIETLQHLRSAAPGAKVILMTAYGTTQTAIEAMKFGAFDYIIKPFDVKKVLELAAKAIAEFAELANAESAFTRLIDANDYKEGLVGSSEPMQEVLKTIGQVAASEATVMITGESGTGKELVARCLFQHSLRAEKAFIAVNCAAIPEELIESELFGHEKGAFTGASQQRVGKFELCDGGTIFLDEIGDMSLPTQTKILRALQEGEIQRVGGASTLKVDVRLIAATNKSLEEEVEKKRFREDLYYRLTVVRIKLPPLRERTGDVPQLVDFILQKLHKRGKTKVKQVSADALDALCAFRWPGNVRELENVMHRSAVVAQGDMILVKDLPDEIARASHTEPIAITDPSGDGGEPVMIGSATATATTRTSPAAKKAAPAVRKTGSNRQAPTLAEAPVTTHDAPESLGQISLAESLDLAYRNIRDETDKAILQFVEREFIQRALNETGGNQAKAAGLLGITRVTLRKRINEYSIKF